MATVSKRIDRVYKPKVLFGAFTAAGIDVACMMSAKPDTATGTKKYCDCGCVFYDDASTPAAVQTVIDAHVPGGVPLNVRTQPQKDASMSAMEAYL